MSKDSRQSPCNYFALRQATRAVSVLYDRHIEKAGITSPQYSILRAIHNHPGITMQELAETMVMDRTAALRALQPLTRNGLVRQAPAPDLARKQSLTLSEAGQAKLAEAEVHWRRAQEEFESSVGKDEAAALRKALLGLTGQIT